VIKLLDVDSKSRFLSMQFLKYAVSFWGLRPQTPTWALPLDPAGGLPSPRPPDFAPPWKKSCGRPWIHQRYRETDRQRDSRHIVALPRSPYSIAQ